MVQSQRVILRDLDENEHQTIGVRSTQLDQSPGLLHRALDDRNPGSAKLAFGLGCVADLKP